MLSDVFVAFLPCRVLNYPIYNKQRPHPSTRAKPLEVRSLYAAATTHALAATTSSMRLLRGCLCSLDHIGELANPARLSKEVHSRSMSRRDAERMATHLLRNTCN